MFVCRKCMKRAGAKALRGTLEEELGRDVRVVASGCLKLCPKDRVTVVVGNGERMRCLVVDPAGDVDALVGTVSVTLDRPP